MDPIIQKLRARLKELETEHRETLKKVEDKELEWSDEVNNRLKAIEAEGRGIDEQIARRQEALAFEKRDLAKDDETTDGKPDGADDKRDQDPSRRFDSLGHFLQAVHRADVANVVDPRLLEIRAATGMSESVPADGGYLVQTDFVEQILARVYEIGQISSRVNRIPISANANGLKMNAIAETSRATGSRWGGVRGYWLAEADEKTASKPTLREIELKLKKVAALIYATDELLQDSTALSSVVERAVSEELNFLTEDSFVNGGGAATPLGILNSPCLVTVAKETGQTAATIVYENIVKMWSRMWARSRPNAVWLINQDVEPELMNMGLVIGTGGTPAYLPPGGLSASPYGTLFGRPVIPVEYCATLGTVGDIILADWEEYLAIDKGGIQAATSIHVRFIYDESAFRFVYRVDGQPGWNSALTPFKGSNTLSPFVALATRA